MTIKGTYPESKQGNFKIIDTIGVPHPYCIGSKLVSWASDHHSGILGQAAIEDAEKHNIHCDICVESGNILSYSEHKQALLVECKAGITDDKGQTNPELRDYLNELKAEAEKNSYVGFAFKKYEAPRPPKTWGHYQKPANYKLGDPGNACVLEPPDHPRYFIRSIYTSVGDSPPRPPYYYLNGTGYENVEDVDHLYKPLPIDNIRVQEWIKALYSHLKHCYRDPGKPDNNKTVIYPVPDYELKHFYDDSRFSDDWRAKEKASIEQANNEILEARRKIATIDNHAATIDVRKYYPDFIPSQELIDNPPRSSGNWWERLETRPTPENCPGEYGHKHPVNGSWCQFCGWHKEDDKQ